MYAIHMPYISSLCGEQIYQEHVKKLLANDDKQMIGFITIYVCYSDHMGVDTGKTCLQNFANNTGADQPAHPRSLISTFVIPFSKSIICNIVTGEISIF